MRPAYVMTHDNTGAVIPKFRSIGASKIDDPRQIVFTIDHDIQNKSEKNLQKYAGIEVFAKEMGVDFYPAGRGIGHQVMVEEGLTTCDAYDTSACTSCGDSTKNGLEFCDGVDLGGAVCADVGFDGGGPLTCLGNCTFDTSACIDCGNGSQEALATFGKEEPEQADERGQAQNAHRK